MDTLVRINNQSAGRDKIARLLQYLSRVLWHRFQQDNGQFLIGLLFKKNAATVNGFKNLEFQLSTFRKLLRFGKCVDVLYSSLVLFDHPDSTIRYSLILSKIANSLFLITDHLLWLGRADVCSVNTEKWGRISNKYWLYSITMNLVRDFYEICCILRQHQGVIVPKGGFKTPGDLYASLTKAMVIVQSNKSVVVDTVKNCCDFFIPLTALGHVNLSPGTVGWLGVVSSLAGLMVLIEPKVKLSPA